MMGTDRLHTWRLLVVLLGPFNVFGSDVAWIVTGPEYVRVGIDTRAIEHDNDELVTFGKELIRRFVKTDAKFAHIWMFDSSEKLIQPWETGFSHMSYEGWRATYSENYKRIGFVGEMLFARPNAVLRLRLRNGQQIQSVVEGAVDSRFVSVGKTRCELLHISYRRSVHWQLQPIVSVRPGEEFATAFVECGSSIDAELAAGVHKELQRRIPISNLRVDLRMDHWFVDDDFPLAYPFAQLTVAPTKAKWDQGVMWRCNANTGELKCVQREQLRHE